MILPNQKGLLGLRPRLLLILIGLFVLWAFYRGYIKWKGPRPAAIAESIKNDVTHSVKQLSK